jgi:hypothetical protein
MIKLHCRDHDRLDQLRVWTEEDIPYRSFKVVDRREVEQALPFLITHGIPIIHHFDECDGLGRCDCPQLKKRTEDAS